MMRRIIYLFISMITQQPKGRLQSKHEQWSNQIQQIQNTKAKQDNLYNVANNNSMSDISQTMSQRAKTCMYIYIHSSCMQLIS
jgi:hypothetical protein